VTPMPNERDDPRPPIPAPGSPVPARSEEPEPDWAEEIRTRRRARGDRLRELFATFDEEPPAPGSDPREPRS
jgi:hypothetical protein